MKTPDSSTVPGMRHPDRALAALRIAVGLWFVKSFVTKLGLAWLGGVIPVPRANGRWVATLPRLVARYAEGNPIGIYREFLLDIVVPHGALFAHLTAVAETAVGIGLTLGLLTLPAALIGTSLVTIYGLANFWQGPSQQGFHLLLLACLAAFVAARAGRWWGLDGWLRARALPRGRAAWLGRLLLVVGTVAGSSMVATPLHAQRAAAIPVILLTDLAFEGRSANSVEPGDSAVASIATARLRASLRGAGVVTLADSARVAQEMTRADRCGASVECMRAVGQRLGAAYLVVGRVNKVSGLIWYLSGQLVSVAGGATLLDESLELKGVRDEIVPLGAASLGRRIVRAVERERGGR